jgi:hypothetical protein
MEKKPETCTEDIEIIVARTIDEYFGTDDLEFPGCPCRAVTTSCKPCPAQG